MPNTLVRVPEITFYPGTPGVPATPGYCTTRIVGYRTVASGSFESEGQSGDVVQTDNPLDTAQFFFRPDALGGTVGGVQTGTGGSQTYYRREPIYETTCVDGTDGVPGTPGTLDTNYGPDWRSSARSAEYVTGGGMFTVDPNGVVIAGLTDRPTSNGVPLSMVRYGVLVSPDGNLYRVLAGVVDNLSIGTASSYASLRISSLQGRSVVEGYDGSSWTTLSVDSLTVAPESIFAAGLLNRESSTLDSPTLTQLAAAEDTASGTLPLTATVAPVVTRFGAGDTTLPLMHEIYSKVNDTYAFTVDTALPLSGEVSESVIRAFPEEGTTLPLSGEVSGRHIAAADVVVAEVSLPLSGEVTGVSKPSSQLVISKQQFFAGNTTGGSVSFSVPKPQFTIEAGVSGPEYQWARASLSIDPAYVAGVGTTGGIGGSALSVPAMHFKASDYNYAEATLQVSPPTLGAYGYSGYRSYVANLDYLVAAGYFSVTGTTLVSFDSGLELSGDASILVILDAEVVSALEVSGDTSFAAVIQAAIDSGLKLQSVGAVIPEQMQQYVYNMATAAVSRFEGFAFDGMTRHGGETFGYTPAGVYRLADNPEEPISAAADFGKLAFSGNSGTYIDAVFLGMASDGTVYLTLSNDGKPGATYRVIERDATMRANPGRGLTAREWHVRLEIVDATQVDLSNVEFIVAASSRRRAR